MKLNIREIYPEIFHQLNVHPVKRSEYYTVNIKRFFEETRFLLSGKLKHTPNRKVRPILITYVKDDKIGFIAFTTDLISRQKRPSVKMECNYTKLPEQCGIEQRNFVWIFGKETNSGKIRFHYEIDLPTFEKLLNEGSIILCGKCSDEMLQNIENLINKYGDII